MRCKVKLKPGIKAYLELASVLIDFVYRSRLLFATNSDPYTCFFFSLRNMTSKIGV